MVDYHPLTVDDADPDGETKSPSLTGFCDESPDATDKRTNEVPLELKPDDDVKIGTPSAIYGLRPNHNKEPVIVPHNKPEKIRDPLLSPGPTEPRGLSTLELTNKPADENGPERPAAAFAPTVLGTYIIYDTLYTPGPPNDYEYKYEYYYDYEYGYDYGYDYIYDPIFADPEGETPHFEFTKVDDTPTDTSTITTNEVPQS